MVLPVRVELTTFRLPIDVVIFPSGKQEEGDYETNALTN